MAGPGGGGAQTGSPCQEFHRFSSLPAELRLKVWGFNLGQPRLVPIRCGSGSLSGADLSRPRDRRTPVVGCTSTAPVPAVLHACHESRTEALKRYSPMLGIARQPGRVFLDPDADILYFGPRDGFTASAAQLRTVLMMVAPEELARVRRVAVSETLFTLDGVAAAAPAAGPHYGRCYQPALAMSPVVEVLGLLRARLPGLRELVFVPRDDNPVYSPAATLVTPAEPPQALASHIASAMCMAVPDAAAPPYCRRPGTPPPHWCIMAIANAEDLPVPEHGPGGFGGPGPRLSEAQASVKSLFDRMER